MSIPWNSIDTAPTDKKILGKFTLNNKEAVGIFIWVSHKGLQRVCGFKLLELVKGKFKKSNRNLFSIGVGSIVHLGGWLPISQRESIQ